MLATQGRVSMNENKIFMDIHYLNRQTPRDRVCLKLYLNLSIKEHISCLLSI